MTTCEESRDCSWLDADQIAGTRTSSLDSAYEPYDVSPFFDGGDHIYYHRSVDTWSIRMDHRIIREGGERREEAGVFFEGVVHYSKGLVFCYLLLFLNFPLSFLFLYYKTCKCENNRLQTLQRPQRTFSLFFLNQIARPCVLSQSRKGAGSEKRGSSSLLGFGLWFL